MHVMLHPKVYSIILGGTPVNVTELHNSIHKLRVILTDISDNCQIDAGTKSTVSLFVEIAKSSTN